MRRRRSLGGQGTDGPGAPHRFKVKPKEEATATPVGPRGKVPGSSPRICLRAPVLFRQMVKEEPVTDTSVEEERRRPPSPTVVRTREVSALLHEDAGAREQWAIFCEVYGAGKTNPGVHHI